MAVQYKFFWVSSTNSSNVENEMNKFLRSVRVVNVRKEFVNNGNDSQFCIIVEYMNFNNNDNNADSSDTKTFKKGKVDYREVLSPEDFSLYDKIRTWRKETAKKEAVQLYTILTNEQMAQIAQKKITTKKGLNEIDGFGEGRMKKYGEEIIEIVTNNFKNSSSLNQNENS